VTTSFSSTNSWVVLNDHQKRIKEKIEKIGLPLKNWDIKINYGIKTGFNEAFIISSEKRDELILKCPESVDIIRPILLGKNVKRYSYEWNNFWVIFTRRGFDIEKYPAIKNHLYLYYEQLRPRNNKEITGRKPGTYKWFEIQDNVAYYEDFEKGKIVWGNLALKSQFSYVNKGFYINAPSAFIATENFYLLAILNSKLGDYYIKQLGISRNGGYVEFKPMFVEKLPIPVISKEEQEPFIKLVNEIINYQQKGEDTNRIEKEIDNMVFKLYELTDNEISTIEIQLTTAK
jgi:adenine-specific DNA-methyltransferase